VGDVDEHESAKPSPLQGVQHHEGVPSLPNATALVLSIDGTCRLCRLGGAAACHLLPTMTIRTDEESVVSGSTVVFKHAGVEFAGYDAIIEMTRLAGGLGRSASRLLSVAPVRLLGNRAYGLVARHRHTISRLLPGVELTQLDTRDGPRNDKPLDL